MKRTIITSALPYANGYIHLGLLAGAYLPADIYARWLRLSGKETLYVCGSDEHGVAITIAAEKENVTPKEIIDKYHIANSAAFEGFGMSFDIYSRTSNALHHDTAIEFFDDFVEKGWLVQKEEEQFYDLKANMFLPDRYVEGICPNCGYDRARGDQCDSCGAYYNQLELKNPKSLVSGEPPVPRKTIHWYMEFGKFQKFLEGYIKSHSSDWKDNVLQQTRSWLNQGMGSRAITRDLNWGVSLEKSKKLEPGIGAGKVLYVWFDAVLGYITATKEYFIAHGKADEWRKWWQDPETRYIAFIGKDNIVFHTLIFPAMLHGRGGYILPDNVPANEFLNLEGQKLSKSRNWSIDLRDFIADFPQPGHIDALRYTLAMNFPETKDSDFSWKDFQSRNNNELSAIYGNFVNRTLQFLHKSFNGYVPQLEGKFLDFSVHWNLIAQKILNNEPLADEIRDAFVENYSENDLNMLLALAEGIKLISSAYAKFRFREGLVETMNIARAANKYFNDEEPWKSIKNDKENCAKTIYTCVQLVRSLAVLFAPVAPFASERVFGFLNIKEHSTGMPSPAHKDYWTESAYHCIPSGEKLSQPEILFARIEDETVAAQVAKLGKPLNCETKPVEPQEKITIDDFKKIQLRTAKVLVAEKVPKSKKLIRLIVEIDGAERQIIAGIAEHYEPEQLLGKTIVVLANLAPAKLMGLESNGMLLAANAPDGKLSIITTEKDGFASGAEVR